MPPFLFSTTSMSCHLVNESPPATGVVVISYHIDESTSYDKGALFRRQLRLSVINWDTLK